MAPQERLEVTVALLAKDPFITKYIGKTPSNWVLERQLQDMALLELPPEQLAQMNDSQLAGKIFTKEALQEAEFLVQTSAKNLKDNKSRPKPGELTKAAKLADPAPDALEPEPLLPEAADQDFPAGARIKVVMDEQQLTAKILLRKLEGSPAPTYQEMLSALTALGIQYGIKSDYLLRLEERPIYGRTFKVAEGQPAVHGVNGEAIFQFDTTVNMTPTIDENGEADYKSLSYVKGVSQGDLLCQLVPPTPGQDGKNIFGEVLPARQGVASPVTAGPNTRFSEDGLQIFATCDGQVILKNDKVSVNKVLILEDVGTKTGNVIFAGAVHVKGDVHGGFLVQAAGDITVDGIVEDARLISGGNISLCGGIKGRDTGVLHAEGHIRTFFIEHAKVTAKKNLYADSIINSTVECGGILSLSGLNGCLVGGHCLVRKAVRAQSIGNDANVPTLVRLNELPALATQYQKDIADMDLCTRVRDRLRDFADKTGRILMNNPEELLVMLTRIIILKIRMELELSERQRRIADYENTRQQRVVIARQTLFPNAIIEIDDVALHNQTTRAQCAIVRRRNKLEVQPARHYL